MEYLVHFTSVILLLVLIVFICEVFTNAIERLGEELNIGHSALGSVFAAIGTALPETIVPLVAILSALFFGGNVDVGREIGTGAILGSPFLLSTLAMFVTAVALIFAYKKGKRTLEIKANAELFRRDLKYFLFSYTLAFGASFLPYPFAKKIIGVFLLTYYLFYAIRTINSCGDECEIDPQCKDLYLKTIFRTPKKYNMILIILQVIISILGLIVASHFFVENIKHISVLFGISPLIMSLFLAPVATELPEMFNSMIWTQKSKDTLALSNITGAMVFQSCIPMAVGLLLTPWVLNQDAVLNVSFVYISVILLYISAMKNKLSSRSLIFAGIFYFVYLAYIFSKTIV